MRRTLFLLVLIVLLTAACGLPAPASPFTPKPAETLPPTAALPTAAPTVVITALQPSLTPLPPTQPAPATVPPTQSAGLSSVKLYLVALEDNGTSGSLIGCGDSLVAVDVPVTPTLGVLRAAYTQLLALKTAYYGQSGLYNALYQSTLSLEGIDLADGKAVIHLNGQFILNGVCDIPRAQAQLEQTALQFNTVKSVQVFVNGIPLAGALSLK